LTTLLQCPWDLCIVRYKKIESSVLQGWISTRGEIVGILEGRNRLLIIFSALFLISGVGWAAYQTMPHKALICEIQGREEISPYLDQQVITSGLVSWVDSQEEGFALIDDRCPLAGESSRGVYLTGEDEGLQLAPGDQVRVRGRVQELAGETQLVFEPGGLEILSLGNPLPDPIDLGGVLGSLQQLHYEDWEGQLITIPRGTLENSPQSKSGLVLLPEFPPQAGQELVCFQRDVFSIQFLPGQSAVDRGGWVSGSTLEELTGLLRQDRSGYSLQLISALNISPSTSIAVDDYSHLVDNKPGALTPTGESAALLTPELTLTPLSSLLPSPTVIPSPTYYPLPLLITELLPNPSGQEPGGEWVEVYNPGGSSFPLDGIKLGDENSPTGKEGMLRFPDGYRIGPGQVLVIANQSRTFEASYGFRPDFEFENSDTRVPDLLPYPEWGRSRVLLSNTGDEILLVSPWDRVLDLIAYGGSSPNAPMKPVPAPSEGHSLERYPPEQDRDQPGDWRERANPSPGRLDRSPPTIAAAWTVDYTISPTLEDTPSFTPSLTSSPTSSPTLTPSLALHTCTPTTTLSPILSPTLVATSKPTSTPPTIIYPTFTNTPPLPTPSWTYTFSPSPAATDLPTPVSSQMISPSPTVQPGTAALSPTADYSPTVSQTSTGTAGAKPTETVTGGTVFPSSTFSPQPSFTEYPTPSPSPSPVNSITPSTTPGITPTSTWPHTPEFSPTSTSMVGNQEIVINEIYADPDPILGDSNKDGLVNSDDDEFLELVNISGKDLNLEGWEVHDGIRLRFTFPAETILGDGCGLVVFGGGNPGNDFGGSLVFTAGSLGLNNSGDTVSIRDSAGEVKASYSYGPEGGEDQSLTRNPDMVGELPLVVHGQIPEAQGAFFSAGTKIDGDLLGDCP
jgi:hypothetical protein